jgi:hypothetical protein
MGRAAHVRLRYIAHFGGQFEADPSVDTATAGVLVQGILRINSMAKNSSSGVTYVCCKGDETDGHDLFVTVVE